MAAQQYDSSGTMDAVTFHGPRNMHVEQKSKPKIEEDGVSPAGFLVKRGANDSVGT